MTYISRKTPNPERQVVAARDHDDYREGSRVLRLFAILFTIFAIVLVVAGWIDRNDSPLTAKTGLGYLFGIIGGSMMLFILLYPARKHIRLLRNFGKIKYWYRTHIICGVCGPVLILFHSNFGFGSPNSRNAMIAMMLVVFSGIVGRFFYRQVHNVLDDHRYSIDQLRLNMQEQRRVMDDKLGLDQHYHDMVERFDTWVASKKGFCAHLFAMPIMMSRSRKLARILVRALKKQVYKSGAFKDWPSKKKALLFHEYKKEIQEYHFTLRKYFSFNVYEKMFSMWYIFHFPLFIVLIFVSSLHVVSVHMY